MGSLAQDSMPSTSTSSNSGCCCSTMHSSHAASWSMQFVRGLAAQPAAKPAAPAKKGKGEGELPPRLKRVVDMLLPPTFQDGAPGMPFRTLPDTKDIKASSSKQKSGEAHLYEEERQREAALRAFKERVQLFEQRQAGQVAAWEKDMRMKHQLQWAALRALPAELREKALQPDTTPFPLNREFLLQTPPKAYGEGGSQQAPQPKQQQQQGGKQSKGSKM